MASSTMSTCKIAVLLLLLQCIDALKVSTVPAGYSFVGNGWCRNGCYGLSCAVQGYSADDTTKDECNGWCNQYPNCIGFAYAGKWHSYAKRCFLYVHEILPSTPASWKLWPHPNNEIS